MTGMLKNSALAAFIRGKKRGRLTFLHYENLLNLNNVSEVASYLKQNTRYGRLLEGVNESLLHRVQFEDILSASLLADVGDIIHFTSGAARSILKVYFLKYEIESLKSAMRRINSGGTQDLDFIPAVRHPYYLKDRFTSIIQVENYSDFSDLIKDTEYHRILAPFISENAQHDMFKLEMALDIFFMQETWRIIARFNDKEMKKKIERTFGSETDMLNIIWIIRGKRYYKLEAEQIYSYVIPRYYKLNKDIITELASAEECGEESNILGRTPYKKIFDSNGKSFETDMLKYMLKLYKKYIKESPNSVMAPLEYLHEKSIEIKNITSIIEGIRYNLSKEEIMNYLVI